MKTKLLKTKQLVNICLIATLTMVFNACQKNELPVTTESFNERGMATKINIWLDKQIAGTVRKDRKANLENLKNNLQTRSLWVEDLRLGKRFVIVPISESMAIKVNKDKPVTNYFVARIDVSGNIYEGEIIQYALPHNASKIPMPVNALHNFHNFSNPEGVFTCIRLTAMDIIGSEMEYNKDGTLVRITKTDLRISKKI